MLEKGKNQKRSLGREGVLLSCLSETHDQRGSHTLQESDLSVRYASFQVWFHTLYRSGKCQKCSPQPHLTTVHQELYKKYHSHYWKSISTFQRAPREPVFPGWCHQVPALCLPLLNTMLPIEMTGLPCPLPSSNSHKAAWYLTIFNAPPLPVRHR